jgi:hypothetical protein
MNGTAERQTCPFEPMGINAQNSGLITQNIRLSNANSWPLETRKQSLFRTS